MTTSPAATAYRGSVLFYRVMAYVTGTLLLVLTVAVILKYTTTSQTASDVTSVVGFAHGWLFVVYVVSIINLGLRAQLDWWRMIVVAICGFVPVFTFVAERSTVRSLQT